VKCLQAFEKAGTTAQTCGDRLGENNRRKRAEKGAGLFLKVITAHVGIWDSSLSNRVLERKMDDRLLKDILRGKGPKKWANQWVHTVRPITGTPGVAVR